MKAFSKRSLVAATVLPLAMLLSSCGGGGPTSNAGGPSVLNMAASNIRYSGRLLVSVSGRLLTEGATMTADGGCDSPAKVAGGTDDAMQFNCTLTATGNVFVRIRNANGDTLASLRVEVPNPQVAIVTTSGTIVVELDPSRAKATVDNFLAYSASNFYANVLIHRVINDVLIQGGGYLTGPKPKLPNRDPIVNESNNGLKNVRGSIAMWHPDGLPDAANAQFFINTKDNPDFDFRDAANKGYAVFGSVVTGLELVDAIKAVATTTKTIEGIDTPLTDTPVTEVRISAVSQTR